MAVQRRRLRTFQERKNVLELYDDRELIKRYRLDHQGILFVTDYRQKFNNSSNYTKQCFNCRTEGNNDSAFFGNWKNAAVHQ